MRKKAIIYTENTDNLLELANFLVQDDWEIISAGETAEFFSKNLIPYTMERSLAKNSRSNDGYTQLLNLVLDAKSSDRLDTFDFNDSAGLVCINIKPRYHKLQEFFQNSQSESCIDVKHVSLIRAAAKNFNSVIILTDPADYEETVIQLRTDSVSRDYRLYLAGKALNLSSAYDAACAASILLNREDFIIPEYFTIPYKKEMKLPHGTNPHQQALLYSLGTQESALNGLKKIQGKEIDYNTIKNYFAVWNVISLFTRLIKAPSEVESTDSENYSFSTQITPAAGSVCTVGFKNMNPIGASLGPDVKQSMEKTLRGDDEKFSGAILGSSAVVDADAARLVLRFNLAAVIAPDFTAEAREILAENKSIRLIIASKLSNTRMEVESVDGGLLVQTVDDKLFDKWHVVTKKRPLQNQIDSMAFGMMMAISAKSDSAIVLNDFSTIGIATAQSHRIKALEYALNEAEETMKNGLTSEDRSAEILISDSSIPFNDRLKRIADMGIKAIIQTGGSENDQAFIEFCDEHEISMVFTGMKHLSY